MKCLKKLMLVALSVIACGSLAQVMAASPSSGEPATNPLLQYQQRKQPQDQDGRPFYVDSFLGYKVFETTATSITQVVDEFGNQPTAGVLHQVCFSTAGTSAVQNGVVVFDSASVIVSTIIASGLAAGTTVYALGTATGLAYDSFGKALMPPLVGSSTTISCMAPNANALDVQFNYGLAVVINANTSGNERAYIYWRPARGGSN